MRRPLSGMAIAVVAAVVLVLAWMSMFVVDPTQQALVLRFGQPVRDLIGAPGLAGRAFGLPSSLGSLPLSAHLPLAALWSCLGCKELCCVDRERPRCFSPRHPQGLASHGSRARRDTNRARHRDVIRCRAFGPT